MCGKSNVVVSMILAAGMVGSVWAGAGPVGWWKFDMGFGTTAYDSSGNNFNGSIKENVSWIEGYIGPYALEFMSGYVTVSDKVQLRPGRLTWSLWINMEGPQDSYTRIIQKGNDNEETYTIAIGGLHPDFSMAYACGDDVCGHGVGFVGDLWTDEWIHMAGVYDGNALSVYVNGESNNSNTTGAFTPLQSGGPLTVGARAPDYTRRLRAKVDDLRIYDYNMTPGEVQELYYEIRDPNIAQWPFPKDEAEDVYPDVVLHWAPGMSFTAHDVYFGTNFNDVNTADSTWPVGTSVYKGSVDVNYYDPAGTLELGQTCFWRIDEVTGSGISRGSVWLFTVDEGKARGPSPGHQELCVAADTGLSWSAGVLATSHDVYFGTDFDDVNEATDPYILPGRGNQVETTYDPGPLEAGKMYYWRVDEVGASTFVKGDIWTFAVEGRMCVKVDFALAVCGANDYSYHWPESAKEGWEIWAQPRWHDMYGHDVVLNDGSGLEKGLGEDFNGPGIGGSGICAGISTVYEGRGGLIMAGPEMCSLNAEGCETEPNGCPKVRGYALYEPICNTWFDITDYPGTPGSTILLALYNLEPGEYWMASYHNRYGGERNGGNPHWECVCRPQLPMTSVTAGSIAHAQGLYPTAAWGAFTGNGNYPVGNPDGVETLQGAYDVEIQQVVTDNELVPSLIKFRTDGSAVMVMYLGTCCVPDDIRPARESGRGILNAFILQQVKELLEAYGPSPEDGEEDVYPDVELGWKSGTRAFFHEVYVGGSFESVRDATTSSAEHKATLPVGENTYSLSGLSMGKTYYWRIDEVNDTDTWTGDVWSFTVLDHFVVDDFEDYTELELIDTWIDGWTTMDNGAVVWLGVPPAPVRDLQSLLYDFDNSGARNGYYSQAYRDINEPNDWTVFGVKVLKLWFYGDPINTLIDTDYFCVGVEDTTGSGSYSEVRYGDSNDMGDLEVAEWHEWNIDLQALAGGGVDLEDVNKLYIIIGDKQNPVAGGGGGVYIDDIWLLGAPSGVYPECWDYLTQCHGDCDNTGDVKGSDFLALKNSWYKVYGEPAYDPCADFDRNGEVKGSDFLVLKNNWYQTVAGDCTPGDPLGIYQ